MPISTEQIREEARRIGFDAVGFASAQPSSHSGALHAWLAAGHHADLTWMAREPERRIDPAQALKGARSVIAVALSYTVAAPAASLADDPLRGRVARYAWGPDYHDVLLPMLMELGRWMEGRACETIAWRAYVDTGPVLEREIAARAGLGFIGRNTLLVSPEYGSFVLLGEILTSLELEPDPPAEQGGALLRRGLREAGCGACRRCLVACPTGAFPEPYVLDARRCIAYLTIEHRGSIPIALRPRMGNWLFGCDLCQTVCPWVRQFSRPGATRFLRCEEELVAPHLTDLLALDDAAFRERFRGTPLFRTKRNRLLRNACVALGNAADPSAEAALAIAARDADPLIREHALWALHATRRVAGNNSKYYSC